MGTRPKLTATEVFFLSFGGQSPFISLVAFGTIMISYVGRMAGFAMLLTTILVMVNALVVYSLSRRFKKGGGYYTYALHTLTDNLGITTGWIYILYSITYGATLMEGAVYVLNLLTGIDSLYLTLIVTLVTSSVVLLGVKISARYAVVVGALEIVALIGLSTFFLYRADFRVYNPVSFSPQFPEAILFGIGIPSGYSSVVSYPEEIKNAVKTVSRVSLLVPLLGGGLATFFFYSLADMGVINNLVGLLLSSFGLPGAVAISMIALSDGVLGGIAYVVASSRTLFAMSKNGHLLDIFTITRRGEPKVAEGVISALVVLSLALLTPKLGPLLALTLLGGISGMSNLYIHMAAAVSLARIGRRKPLKHIHEILFSIGSLILSGFILTESISQLDKYVVYFFLAWIILGFLFAESLELVRQEEEKRTQDA